MARQMLFDFLSKVRLLLSICCSARQNQLSCVSSETVNHLSMSVNGKDDVLSYDLVTDRFFHLFDHMDSGIAGLDSLQDGRRSFSVTEEMRRACLGLPGQRAWERQRYG